MKQTRYMQQAMKRARFAAPALLALSGLVACLEGGGSLTNLPEQEYTAVNLQIRLGRVDASAPVGGDVDILTKPAATHAEETIRVRDMIMRFTSNLRDTIWDTTALSAGSFYGPGKNEDGGIVNTEVVLPPLRWWKIEIKTLDMLDSVIHYDTIGPIASRGGQTVVLNVPLLNARYTQYEAHYQLPKEIYAANLPVESRVYQKIFFSRLEMAVDGVVVRDTSSFSPAITSAGTRFITADSLLRGATPGMFFFKPSVRPLDTITHVQAYPYVRVGPHEFRIRAFGYLEGDTIGMAPRLLFEGSQSVAINPGVSVPPIEMNLAWRGPGGVPTDTTQLQPGHPDWSGTGLKVVIGRTGTITQTINIGVNIGK